LLKKEDRYQTADISCSWESSDYDVNVSKEAETQRKCYMRGTRTDNAFKISFS